MDINKKELVETLTRGRNSAMKLQNLLIQKDNDDELVCVDDLVTEISQSFYGGLLVLNACNSGDPMPEVHTGKTPALASKGRRGCYKRRKTVDSRMEVSETIEDGYAWRKYGQKEILSSNFPRCYFRCTHKQVYGCKALKQVQKLEDGSNMFHIIYFGHHTCPPPNNTSSHPKDHSLPNSPSTTTKSHIDPSAKEDDLTNKFSSASGAQSCPALVWKEILLDEFECFKNDGSLSDMSFDDIVFS
ncbi:putative transcription factor WRKY family [Helianthus annuus]|uniref:WRKY DNA-binding transcription factor 70-like n=1 Tax=Helianthus annuus TaxID=4232 RepID=UPI000B8F9C82|nr:WRKY DNA-binding transcription factor 70-like [Helianthus annuus]KAJ0466034.1 putative transcription factor WRKY family [Helianthus annuus]KAJ0487614.1 putative transcription factor WRKY family [Helianthus annuus]KAJ0658055.1 putative transcription factor WRKY family [Helianthus annuus]KAJ0661726.1 putative transcription factor WRKY family [Helianthus annuus]